MHVLLRVRVCAMPQRCIHSLPPDVNVLQVIALSEALPDGVRLTAAWDTQAREPPPMGVSRDAASSGCGSQDLLAPAGEDGDSLRMPSSPPSRRRGARVKLESVAK